MCPFHGACNRPCPKGPTNICSNPSDLAPCMPCGEAQNQRTRPSLNVPKNKFADLSDLAWSLSSVSVHWALQGAKGIHGPNPYKLIGFGGLHGPEPYKCTSVGGIHPQVYKLIKGLVASTAPNPINLQVSVAFTAPNGINYKCGGIHGPEPYKSTSFGGLHGPKRYKLKL